jgi:hypothetical protein
MENKMKVKIKNIPVLIIAVLIIISTAASAQQFGQGMNGMNPGQGRGFHGMSPFIEPVFMGHGFAFSGEDYHILHVNVIKMKKVSPVYVRSLLEEFITPLKIAQQINSLESGTEVDAHIRFAGLPYVLNLTSYNNQTISGDIMTLSISRTYEKDFIPEVAGNLSITTSDYEGELFSSGTLTMGGRDYQVLLTSPMNLRKGMGRWI